MDYNYYRTHKIIPKGLSIKCRPSFDTDDQQFLQGWTSLLRKTSFQMMSLLKRTYQEHHKNTKIELSDSLEQLKSTCPDVTQKKLVISLKLLQLNSATLYNLGAVRKGPLTVNTLLLRLCTHITGSSPAITPLPLTTHQSHRSRQPLLLTLITTHLLTRTNIAADVDVSIVLHDTGGETTTTSNLTPTLLSILATSLFHTTRPNY